jgi:RNA polymerase sigma factor (sigma-70 family)
MLNSTYSNILLNYGKKWDETGYSIGNDLKMYDANGNLCNALSQYKIEAKCNSLVKKLRHKYYKLIFKYYNENPFNFEKHDFTLEDCFNECVMVIIKKYDVNKAKISTFLFTVLKNILAKKFNKINKTKNTISLNNIDSEPFYHPKLKSFVFEDVEPIINNSQAYNILVMRYKDGMNLKEIASYYKKSKTWVNFYIRKSLNKIKKEWCI